MDKKRLTLSIAQLFLALAAFTVVSFAWFAISTEVDSEAIQFNVSHAYVEGYEVRFFTNDNIYKYMTSLDEIYIYDQQSQTYVDPSDCLESVCDTPSYGYWDDSYDFAGIFLDQYDPLIPINNQDNNLFIELHLIYEVETDKYLSIDASGLNSMANTGAFGTSDFGPHYLSQVVNIQYMSSTDYTSRPESTNIFSDLTSDFNSVDINEDLVYPKYNFYEDIEVFNFGKHKGKAVEDIFKSEPSYYDWMMKSDFPLSTKKIITGIKLRGFNQGSLNFG